MQNNREKVLDKYQYVFFEEKKFYDSVNLHKINSFDLKVPNFFQDVNLCYLDLIGEVKNKKILDICCGKGILSYFFASKNADVIGIDLSEKHINFCKKESNRLRIKAKFFVMNAQIPEFEKNSFDIITGYRAIHHLPNLNLFFENCYRLLKPNGFIIFVEPLKKNPIVQFNRKYIAPNARTIYEHPLKMKDLKRAKLIFGNLEHYEYHLISPIAWVFKTKIKNKKIYKYIYKILNYLEKPFLNIKFLQPYCWQTVFKCQKQS